MQYKSEELFHFTRGFTHFMSLVIFSLQEEDHYSSLQDIVIELNSKTQVVIMSYLALLCTALVCNRRLSNRE